MRLRVWRYVGLPVRNRRLLIDSLIINLVTAGPRVRMTQPEGIIVEGRRTNLVPNVDSISKQLSALEVPFTFSESSALGVGPCWVFQLAPKSECQVHVRATGELTNTAYTASCFAWSISVGAFELLSRIEVDGNVTQRSSYSQAPRDRSTATASGSCPPDTLSASWTFRNLTNEIVETFFAYPMIESGAFDSTPIPPGETREPDLLDLNEEVTTLFATASEGTILLLAIPKFSAHEIRPEEDLCFFGAASAESASFVEVVCSGRHGGAICVRYPVDQANNAVYVTSYKPQKGSMLAVALVWSSRTATLFIDGHLHAVIDQKFPDFGSIKRARLGNSARSDNMGSFITLRRVLTWGIPLTIDEIQATLASAEPSRFTHFVSVIRRLSDYSTAGWPYSMVMSLFRIVRELQDATPLWTQSDRLDEGQARDQVKISLRAAGSVANAEVESGAGRTDLLIELNDKLRLRAEFKIWGRNDYSSIPEKPLKYMGDGEKYAIVVMINPNKSEIGRSFRENIGTSATGCIALHEAPFGTDGLPDHFVSIHRLGSQDVAVLHLILNLHSPFDRLRSRLSPR